MCYRERRKEKNKVKEIELLAPAGSFEKAKIAFLYGADAVYCGTASLSLRSRAEIQDDDLIQTIKYAHSIGKKVYVALNIYAWDETYPEIIEMAKKLEEIKPTNKEIENYFKNYDYFYPFTKETSYSGYQSVVISCLITMLVLNTNIKNTVIKKGIYILSKHTLGTYLISYIFDVVLYYIVKHIFNNIAGLSLVLPFTILVNLILSTLTSFFITEISEKLYKVISKKMLD